MRWSVVLMISAALIGSSTPIARESADTPIAVGANFDDQSHNLAQIFDPFTYFPLEQRLVKLDAKSGGLDQIRARLVKADIYLNNRQPKEAIAALNQLEQNYPLLADYILVKRAQAYTQIGDRQSANATWQAVISQYVNSPAAAEAMFAMGQNEQLLTKFPAHPRSQDLVLRLLSQNPNSVDLLLHLVTYFGDYKQIVPIADRLMANSTKLTADQWWAIADVYYKNWEFAKAATAYSRATVNPITTYNYARSLQRNDQDETAIAAYNRVVQQFPQSPQAPRALIRLTQVDTPQNAIAALDRLIANYPDTVSEALAIKAEILQNKLGSPQAASVARNQLLEKYGSSNEAGELRWRIAKGLAKSGQLAKAIAAVDNLIVTSPNSLDAAEATFWAGKWANQIGDKPKAKSLFEFTIREHPDSYYAWRSATSLGWQVGNFTTVRYTAPAIAIPSERTSLPAGSAKLQELYILGLDRDARSQWVTELAGKKILTPKEVFTDGVLRVAVLDNLIGIRTLESLDWIDVPATEKAEIPKLKQHPAYIRSLYPFHYWDSILKWSQERQLAPALVIALMRQESRFEAQIRSSAGAIGLMQVMPETGSWIAGQKGVKSYNLDSPMDNISFGTWYLDYTHSRYGNNSMLAIASYNAGPGAVGSWVESRGVGDPDEFVNSIPYSETRDYVSKVLGNYWNYLRLYSPTIQQQINTLKP